MSIRCSRNGYWTGIEVENTPFKGMNTVFFNRYTALLKYGHHLQQKHVFIDIADSKFSDSIDGFGGCRQTAIDKARNFLIQNYCVTVAINANWADDIDGELLLMRKTFPSLFCLLIVAQLPQPEAGGFAVKIVPEHCFNTFEHETGVMTLPAKEFEKGFTPWSAYAEDQDGE